MSLSAECGATVVSPQHQYEPILSMASIYRQTPFTQKFSDHANNTHD